LVYELVGRNSLVLTGGESWVRGGEYYPEEEIKTLKESLIEDLKRVTNGDAELSQVRGILLELFPEFEKLSGKRTLLSREQRKDTKGDEKRIYHPEVFPAYFRYELPNSLFSSVELEGFLGRINNAATDEERRRIFDEELNSMEKGSLKRDNFLSKLSDEVKAMPLPVARSLALAVVKAGNR